MCEMHACGDREDYNPHLGAAKSARIRDVFDTISSDALALKLIVNPVLSRVKREQNKLLETGSCVELPSVVQPACTSSKL
mgnify:CR=1 FL=1